jgi:hypothetical protein
MGIEKNKEIHAYILYSKPMLFLNDLTLFMKKYNDFR